MVRQVTVVHLVRHGEVDNPGGILYGRLPGFGLSERGHRMARALATRLTDRDIGAIVSSPLNRTVQTARPLAEATGLDVRTDSDLIDAGCVFEGMVWGAGPASRLLPRNWRYAWNPLRPSWGEPYAAIAARMRAAVDAARIAAGGLDAVCVSHQLPIWTVRRSYEGRRLWHHVRERRCEPASITSLRFDGGRLLSVEYDSTASTIL